MNNSLKKQYQEEIIPKLKKELGIENKMAVPKLKKVVVNMGIGDISNKEDSIKKVRSAIAAITGQQPVTRSAKKSIAEFGVTQGDTIGLSVTLRGKKMYQFLERLFRIVLPRVRDFNGVSKKSFDGQGNYTLGLEEQTLFPEVDYDKIDKVRGFEITIVTNSKDDKKSLMLLDLMGMPFKKEEGA